MTKIKKRTFPEILLINQDFLDWYYEEFGSLENIEENFIGNFENVKEFVYDLLGNVLDDAPIWVHIDWEKTKYDIKDNFAVYENYYFHNHFNN